MEVIKIRVAKAAVRVRQIEPVTTGMVGATVTFSFGPEWAGLTRTAVFRAGAVAKDVVLTSDVALIPPEVLVVPASLYVGVYGCNSKGTLVIPTIMAQACYVRAGADPSGDESTDPTLPVWQQILSLIGPMDELGTEAKDSLVAAINEVIKIAGGDIDPEVLAEAVTEYLAANPIQEADPTVPAWAKQPTKPGYTAEEVGAVATVNGIAPDESGNVQITIPESGGDVDYVGVEPAEDDMPKVFISGVKPTTKDDVLAEMEYVSKTDRFHAYLEIKCQGTSSMAYAKKNFTVKMYSDEARETKLKKSFKGWNHNGNKYVLKANWIDHSHARNIVSARLWNEVVKSRPDYDSLPTEMKNSPRNGAVDGFPVKVYYNGTYEGIYTWNIGKDDWMWGMNPDANVNHVLLCAEGNTDGVYAETTSNFRKLWDGVDGSKPGWSVEVGTNSTALKNSLNNLIQFVMDNDGDDFRNGIGNYLDIQSAIDYYIFQYEICGLDGLAHNMLLATYDGKLWRCGAYDLDSTFGLWWTGSKFVSATFACPEDYQERYSLLWERIEANFLPELKARQAYLRKTVLSYSNMVTHFERFMDVIGPDLYAEDLTVYSAIPSGSTNNIKQIRNYIRDRQVYVDAEFAAMTVPVSATGIALSKTALTFNGTGSQTLVATVEPENSTDTVAWESSDVSVATVNGGLVNAVGNGSTTITARAGNVSAQCAVSVSGIAVKHTVTNNLTNVTTSNTATTVTEGESYSAILTASSGTFGAVTVTMGGVDVTAEVYADGAINISSVSGNIVITATAVRDVDYTKNALADVEWISGSVYNKNTGDLEVASGEHCTNKFKLQDCLYDFNDRTGGQYEALYAWDENGNYLWRLEPQSVKDIYFAANPNYTYAFKFYKTGTPTKYPTLMPVDHSATVAARYELDIAGRTDEMGPLGYGYTYFNTINSDLSPMITSIDSALNLDGVDKVNHFVFFGELSLAHISYNANFSTIIHNIRAQTDDTQLWCWTNFATKNDVSAYLQENNVKLVFN